MNRLGLGFILVGLAFIVLALVTSQVKHIYLPLSYSQGLTKTTQYISSANLSPYLKNHMKKAQLDDVTSYTGQKFQKVMNKFKRKKWKTGHLRWELKDWIHAASFDGFICRNNSDCSWLDDDLHCLNQDDHFILTNCSWSKDDLECLDHQPGVNIANTWFGGDVEDTAGKCECSGGFWWDEDELLCQRFWDPPVPWWATLCIAVAIMVPLCCCCYKTLAHLLHVKS